MKTLFILWQDENTSLWHAVAKLTQESDKYCFVYTKGANSSNNFTPFPNMPDMGKNYESKELFPFFKNRIISRSRPEFKKLASWLDLDPDSFDVLEYLGITGGGRRTDNFRILKLPVKKKSKYTYRFLVSGINYLEDASQLKINHLNKGDVLEHKFEETNIVDPNAIMLFDRNSKIFVGYCPRYLVADFKALIQGNRKEEFQFTVQKVNGDAPNTYKLLVDFEANECVNYKPFLSYEYEVIDKRA